MRSRSSDYRFSVINLLNLPENQVCADCQSCNPEWASCNLGIFICMECSGIHRSLGTHISFVRSCKFDSWTKEQSDNMRSIGNRVANQYWEAKLPKNFIRPQSSDRSKMEEFIFDKYINRKWSIPGMIPPNEQPLAKRILISDAEIKARSVKPTVSQAKSVSIDDLLAEIDSSQKDVVTDPIPAPSNTKKDSGNSTPEAADESEFSKFLASGESTFSLSVEGTEMEPPTKPAHIDEEQEPKANIDVVTPGEDEGFDFLYEKPQVGNRDAEPRLSKTIETSSQFSTFTQPEQKTTEERKHNSEEKAKEASFGGDSDFMSFLNNENHSSPELEAKPLKIEDSTSFDIPLSEIPQQNGGVLSAVANFVSKTALPGFRSLFSSK